MRCPALMPHELDYCEKTESPSLLIMKLKQKPVDMVSFVESACEDHTWLEENRATVEEMLQWLTRRFYEDKLALDYLQRLVSVLRRNYSTISNLLYFPYALYYNIIFLVDEKAFLVNSLIFGAASEDFKNIIKRAWNNQVNETRLKNMSPDIFPFIIEFINTGTVARLWKRDYQEIVDLMHSAASWNLVELISLCASTLKRYLTKENVITTLIQAHREGFLEWKQEACSFFNQLDRGIILSAATAKTLTLEFLNFKEVALEAFHQLSPYITHLVFGGMLSNSGNFKETIESCPKLRGIDLSGSKTFHEHFADLPANLKELDLSSCGWLNDQTFQSVLLICPNLERLILKHNVNLSFVGWSEINKLHELKFLDISRCRQIDDDLIKLIAQSSPNLEGIRMDGCPNVTDNGMLEAIHWWRYLTFLDISDCRGIENGTLTEVSRNCLDMIDLRLIGCTGITAKGVKDVLHNLYRLQNLNISGCYLALDDVEEWRSIRPLTKIIF